MGNTTADEDPAADDQLSEDAVEAATAWGAGRTITGMWLSRRRLSIGVGLAEGDEIETTEALRGLVSPRISIRTRVAPSRTAELWQLQADVSDFLDVTGIWARWASSLGAVERRDVLEVGLLPCTPSHVQDEIRHAFPEAPIVFITAGPAIAL